MLNDKFPELISDNETRVLVESEKPEQLIDKINKLLDDDQTQNKLAKNAFEFINKNFSWDVLIERYMNLYKS